MQVTHLPSSWTFLALYIVVLEVHFMKRHYGGTCSVQFGSASTSASAKTLSGKLATELHKPDHKHNFVTSLN